jgi:hypothetical protein
LLLKIVARVEGSASRDVRSTLTSFNLPRTDGLQSAASPRLEATHIVFALAYKGGS